MTSRTSTSGEKTKKACVLHHELSGGIYGRRGVCSADSCCGRYYLRQAEGRHKEGGPPPPHVDDPSLPGTGHFLMYPVPGVNGELETGKRRVMWAWCVQL